MAEQLINEFTVNRPIEEAWPLITDLERIAPCLPGAELQEVEGETYRGVVKVKLGAISSQFKGEAHFVERDDENYRAVIKGAGRDTGGRGNASAEISAQAESLSPTSTRVAVTTDLHITGKVAQFGRGIMGDVSAKLMAQFADNLNQMIDEQGVGVTAPSAEAPTQAAAEATDGEAAPAQVRKIDGPATEPIDLMEVGGSSSAVDGADGRPRPGRRTARPPAGRRVRRGRARRARRPCRGPQRPVPRRRHADADALLPRRIGVGARRQPAGGGRRCPRRRVGDRPRRAASSASSVRRGT
jgi:carbon monoxide dehydrogenase subunit G